MAFTRAASALCQDAAYAWRLLRRDPKFTAVVVATLALGIGLVTATFTAVDAVLLRPLPFSQPDELATIRVSSGARLSPAYQDAWRRQSRTATDIAGWFDAQATLTGDGDPFEVQVDRTTSNFFAVLGASIELGRTFTTHPDLGRVEAEAVLSHGFWQRRYGGDPRIVGRSITLDGRPLVIVGVIAQGFVIPTNELAQSRAELWTPFPLAPGGADGTGGYLNLVARLAPGVTARQSQEDLAAIARRLEAEHPSPYRDWRVQVIPLLDAAVRGVRPTLLMLFGSVGLLLLIACANVASLLLCRGVARQTEFAIRRSLGATTGRLVRQSLSEAITLTVIAAGLGVVLAESTLRLLVWALPSGLDVPRIGSAGLDARALIFALVVTAAVSLFFGLLPSLRQPSGSLRVSPERSVESRSLVGSTAIVAEVALAVVVLAGAGLLLRSFRELSRVNPGFAAEHVLTVRITLPESKYDADDRLRAFGQGLVERVAHLPGVRWVGSADYVPMSNIGRGASFEIEGRPQGRPQDRSGAWVSVVGGRYFEAMGIPLLRGRLPNDADNARTPQVVVIDDELRRRDWPTEDPIGKRIIWQSDDGLTRTAEIIGVVGAVRWGGAAAHPPATAYKWFAQAPTREMTLVVRADAGRDVSAAMVSAQVKALDPNQPIGEIRPMEGLIADDVAQPRFSAWLLVAFAAIALMLVSVGLSAVVALWTARRTREIGIRIALGARRIHVLRAVMARGLTLVAGGIGIGIAAVLLGGRLVASLLYGIAPSDPVTLLLAPLLLAAVAAFGMYLPARRATRVDPIVAIRAE